MFMKIEDLIGKPVQTSRLQAPDGVGAYPSSFVKEFKFESPSQEEMGRANKIWELLAQAGFGFDKRPWLVSSGTCYFPGEVADQIMSRADLMAAYLQITEDVLDEKFGGPPTKLLGLPTREKFHRATIVRFDDILTPEGRLLMTEPEGWSSGQGQITVASDAYRMECGKDGVSTIFAGIHVAATHVLKQEFGSDAKVAVVVPEIPGEKGWKFITDDFKLFAGRCQQLGLDIAVEKPNDIRVSKGRISGKNGKNYDVLYPFFPPAGYIDEKVTLGKGPDILKVWADGGVELFPEPSWLQTKQVMTAVFDPELENQYAKKISEIDPAGVKNLDQVDLFLEAFRTGLFPWSWPLNPEKPPVLLTGEQMEWDQFLSPDNLETGWVFKPLLGTECAGMVFSDEMDFGKLKDFAKRKMASFKPDEPYPLQSGTASREMREGVTFENDYRSYFVQALIPNEQFAVRYLNPKKTGLRTRRDFNARICSTIFIDKSGNALVGDCDVTLRQDKRVHGATNSVVTIATF